MSVAVWSTDGLTRHARSVAVAVGICAAAAATAGALALMHGAAHGQSTVLAVTTIVAGCMFVAAGIVAWLRRPANLTGPLMVAAGFLLFGGSLAQANQSVPFTIGLVVGPIPAAIIAQLMLAFPDGRLHSRWERWAVGAAYFDVIVLQIAMLMFMGFENLSGCPCPDNLLLVRDDMTVHSALMGGQRVVTTAVAVWIGVLLARRWYFASRPLRRAIAPVLSAGAVTVALLVGALLVTNQDVSQVLDVAAEIGLATVPLAYLMGLFAARMARVSVGDLVVELSRLPAPGQLRGALARALGDPSVELAYWIPESGTYVGIEGQPVEVRAAAGRSVSVLEVGGRRVAALLVTFRSIVIALKAIVLNTLSVAAAYGFLVAVFQWGWGGRILGIHATHAIATWIPIFLFVVLFGLSMDYHVFILSRVREAVDKGMTTEQAVSHGIRSTAGTVTSAAAIMVVVFSIFGSLGQVSMKEIGIGLAVAVLLDATIVRAVLLPASMKLLGEWNWWLPKPLHWLPRLPSHESPILQPVPSSSPA